MIMIKLEKIFVLLFLLGLSVRMSAVGLDKRFQILPLPQQMEIQKGKGISAGELKAISLTIEFMLPASVSAPLVALIASHNLF